MAVKLFPEYIFIRPDDRILDKNRQIVDITNVSGRGFPTFFGRLVTDKKLKCVPAELVWILLGIIGTRNAKVCSHVQRQIFFFLEK